MRSLNWVGNILAVGSIVFVALRLLNCCAEIKLAQFHVEMWLKLAGYALIYGLISPLLSLSWRRLLMYLKVEVTWQWALKTYGLSQIAKYIPGNIFHFAGRQAIGMSAGISGWALAKSTIWELVLISSAGGLLSLMALPLVLPVVPAQGGVVIFILASGAGAFVLHRFAGPFAVWGFFYYLFFLSISSIIFIEVLDLIAPVPFTAFGYTWLSLCGAYVFSWLVGLLMPGAPAGAGVREMVLLFLMKGIVADGDLIVVVLLGRFVTVAGDFIFYLIAATMKCGKDS